MKVQWSGRALADLNRFSRFLQDRFPDMATIVAREMVQKSRTLAEHPELGRPLARRSYVRQLVVRVLNATYVMHYRVMQDRVVILRIFHGREVRDRQR